MCTVNSFNVYVVSKTFFPLYMSHLVLNLER